MVSALDEITRKLGEKREVKAAAETIQGSSLLQQSAAEFAVQELRRQGCSGSIHLVDYRSVVRMVEGLRHGNPMCQRTVTTYIAAMGQISRLLGVNPDELVESAKNSGEDDLQNLFLRLDERWIQEANSPGTRRTKLSALTKFLYENGVRKVRLIKSGIRKYPTTVDYALTKDDCRKMLESCKTTQDRILIAMLIESLQRIGTINSLLWGDVMQHIERGEDIFLIKIDYSRTKRNVQHWLPVGRLSSYYLRKRLAEFRSRSIELTPETHIFTSAATSKLKPVKSNYLTQKIHTMLLKLGIAGQKQGNGVGTRWEKHCHDFRKFGVGEMQAHHINEEVVKYLMGQKPDTYTKWENRPEELLRIYRDAMPCLDQANAVDEIVDFAKSRGYQLDPKALTYISREIRTSSNAGEGGQGAAEERGQETPFRNSQEDETKSISLDQIVSFENLISPLFCVPQQVPEPHQLSSI